MGVVDDEYQAYAPPAAPLTVAQQNTLASGSNTVLNFGDQADGSFSPIVQSTPPSNISSSGLVNNSTQADHQLLTGQSSSTSGQPTPSVDQQQIGALNINITGSLSEGTIEQNSLNGYMDVMYNVQFGMVNGHILQQIQSQSLDPTAMTDGQISWIASTGGIAGSTTSVASSANPGDTGQDGLVYSSEATILGAASTNVPFPYYAIKKLNVTNIMAPSAANPLIGNMVEMKMVLSQPYGFTLHKDLLSLAQAAQYDDINPGRIVYRVDVFWSGFNQDTGVWTPKIPIINAAGQTTTTVTYFTIITDLTATPNTAGTEYQISMYPYSSFAMRPEIAVADGTTIPIDGTKTFGTFLTNLATGLQKQRTTNTSDQFNITYKFVCPAVIRDALYDASNSTDVTKDTNGAHNLTVSKGADIFMILKNALDSLPIRQDLFMAEKNNDAFTTPRVQFIIRFNTQYSGTKNSFTNDYQNITYTYYIEPYLSFKKATVTKSNYQTITSPDSQQSRLDEMIKLGMIIRRYDYYFTGDNTDVIDFQFNYKVFYFETLTNSNNDSPQQTGQNTSQTVTQLDTERKSDFQSAVSITDTTGKNNASAVASIKNSLLGSGSVGGNQATTQRPTQGLGETPNPQGANLNKNDGDKKLRFLNSYDDHLSKDMMKIDHMIVRGDPIWMLSPYSAVKNTSLTYLTVAGDTGNDLLAYASRCVLIRAYSPSQSSYLNPTGSTGGTDVSTLGGFYEIYRVESEFADGKFTQNLNGYKLTHLDFIDKKVFVQPLAEGSN